ncbi:MAG TPA: polyamine aminopropyltransferase [Burkholderiales bacterium]
MSRDRESRYSTERGPLDYIGMNFFARWRLGKTRHGADSVYVTERFGVRSLHIGSDTIQSSMRLARPNDLELAYTRSMMAFLLFVAPPRRVLMVGLGGGSLAKFVYHRLPESVTEVLEVNPQVVAIARRLFELPAADARLIVRVCDAAPFIAGEGGAFDVILVDGYDGTSHVADLATVEFYGSCRRRLASGGVLVVNLWGSDHRFDDTLGRIEGAFPSGTLCLPAEKPGNIIVFAFRDPPASLRWDELEGKTRDLEARYGLEFGRFVRGLRKMNRADAERLYVSGKA